jgi:hypothetical protein
MVQQKLNPETIDYAKWASVTISILALAVSASTFYMQTIHEIHDFRTVDFGSSVLLINAGNRTETLARARYLYSEAKWKPGGGGDQGETTGPIVLKPGEAQVIQLSPIPDEKLNSSLRTSRHVSIDFLIVNTRTGSGGQKVFVETVLG